MRTSTAKLSTVLVALAAAASAAPSAAAAGDFGLESTIAFSSNRDNLNLVVTPASLRFEVYLMRADGTGVRRLTTNADSDGFAALSSDGKKIVFDSNRNRPQPGSLPCPVAPGGTLDPSFFISDLFLMETDGGEQTPLTRASSATWSPDSKKIAFHASASGAGCPSRSDPGAAATDSDIFVADVDDLGIASPTNITNTPDKIDDDADWSATGQRIVYTAHDLGDDISNPANTGAASNSAELYLIDADGTDRLRLTNNDYEERAAAWSPNGDKIVYSCRIGAGFADTEICLINSQVNEDGTLPTPSVLTNNAVPDLSASFSPDGQRIVFQRLVPNQGNQLFAMRPTLNENDTMPTATQLTFLDQGHGMNFIPNWGQLRVKVGD
jgi:Tol biopolymer transport system component